MNLQNSNTVHQGQNQGHPESRSKIVLREEERPLKKADLPCQANEVHGCFLGTGVGGF
jgi:hypothetical protein